MRTKVHASHSSLILLNDGTIGAVLGTQKKVGTTLDFDSLAMFLTETVKSRNREKHIALCWPISCS